MSSSRSDWPAAPDFHPEFGFLCPSARKRRGLRLAMAFIATTLVIGATMGFALDHRTDGVGSAATAPTDEKPLAQAAPAADPDRGHETCRGDGKRDGKGDEGDAVRNLAAFFLGSACESSKPHVRHGARAANRVATVIIGRTEALPALPAATPAAAVAATAVEPSQVDCGKAEKPANVTTAAFERTAPPKKPKKTPTVSAAVSAYAYAPRSRFQSYQPQPYQPQPYQPQSYQPQSYQPYGDAFRSGRSWRQWP